MVQQTFSSGGESDSLSPRIPSRILILYASQTGQAESISEFIYQQFITGPLKPILDSKNSEDPKQESFVQRSCSSSFEDHKDFFELKNPSESLESPEYYLLITVASTTGQGDPPDSALKFYRYLKKLQRAVKTSKGALPFEHIRYALLGLGDTNYDNFAQYSKNLNRVFQELGAKMFVDSKYADDAGELETVTEPFIENLTETLLSLYTGSSAISTTLLPEIMDSSDKQSSELISGLQKLEIFPEKLPQISESFQKSPERQKFEIADAEKVNEINRKYQSLRGPFPAGEDSEYRKMPASKIAAEKLEILSGNSGSLLEFFQNRQKDSIVYDGIAEIDPENVLREVTSGTLLTDKLTFKSKITFPMSPSQLESQRSSIPGDSYGIYSMNSLSDIVTICRQSTFQLPNEECDKNILEFLSQDPERILGFKDSSQKGVFELLSYLAYCVDSRTLVKRRDLYQFSTLAGDPAEASALREISTRKSNKLYDTVILPNMITICDILRLFPSIRLDISVLIGMLNPAKPRYFSLSDLPDISEVKGQQVGEIWVALKNDLPKFLERQDDGLLGQFSGKFFLQSDFSNESIYRQLREILTAGPRNFHCSPGPISGQKVPIFVFLRPNTFAISQDFEIPAIFFSAGTGLSPFLSYFKSREQLKEKKERIFSKNILFHGARSRDSVVECSTLVNCFDKNDKNTDKDLLFLCLSRQESDLSASDSLSKFPITRGRVPESFQQNSAAILELLKSRIDAEIPVNVYICGGKAFENAVKDKLKIICEESNNILTEGFWNDKLVKNIHVDQW